jgi:hypothetical protein
MAGEPKKEAVEDLATPSNTCYKNPQNMPRHVSGIYTRTVFNMFEDEFVEL